LQLLSEKDDDDRHEKQYTIKIKVIKAAISFTKNTYILGTQNESIEKEIKAHTSMLACNCFMVTNDVSSSICSIVVSVEIFDTIFNPN